MFFGALNEFVRKKPAKKEKGERIEEIG